MTCHDQHCHCLTCQDQQVKKRKKPFQFDLLVKLASSPCSPRKVGLFISSVDLMKNPQEAFRSEMYVAVKTSGVPTQRRNTTYKNSPYTLIVHSPTKRYRIYSCQIYHVNVYPFPISRKLLYFHYYEILTSKSILFILNSKVSASLSVSSAVRFPKHFRHSNNPKAVFATSTQCSSFHIQYFPKTLCPLY